MHEKYGGCVRGSGRHITTLCDEVASTTRIREVWCRWLNEREARSRES